MPSLTSSVSSQAPTLPFSGRASNTWETVRGYQDQNPGGPDLDVPRVHLSPVLPLKTGLRSGGETVQGTGQGNKHRVQLTWVWKGNYNNTYLIRS